MRSTGRDIHHSRPGLAATGTHLLVIEDGSDALLQISNQLAQEGFHLTRAASADEALSLAADSPPEVAVLPPAVIGDPAASALSRLLHERFRIALVCLIASSEEAVLERARSLEPYAYVFLPAGSESLRAAIELALLIRDLASNLHGSAASALVSRLSQHLTEQALERQREARSREQLMTRVAHELRTPLASIIGVTDTFLMGLHGELNPTQARHIQTIQRAGEHLLSLVDELINLAKLASAESVLHIVPVSCTQVIEEVTSMLIALAERKKLLLQVPVTDEELFALADRRGLMQILFNLIGNAVKFTERGAVSVICQRVTAAGSEPRISIEVRDTGPGMDRGRPHGSGLGLQLSSRLAARMDGFIHTEAGAGGGTVVTLDLPAAVAAGP